MQSQRIFWLTTMAVTCLGFTVTYWYNQHSTPTELPAEKTKTTSHATTSQEQKIKSEIAMPNSSKSTTSLPTINPELQARIDTINNRRPNFSYSAAEIAAAVERKTSWSSAETAPKDLPLTQEELADGREFIQLDSLKMETLIPGDTINVQVAENAKDYEVIIDKVEKHDYNSISWYGYINGEDGQKYSVSFTRGETLTVGGLDTPDGHYVLQAHGKSGWIASSQLLFKVDPNVQDAIHPADIDPNYAPNREPHTH